MDISDENNPVQNKIDSLAPEKNTANLSNALPDEHTEHRITSLKELSILLYYYATAKQKQLHHGDNQSIICKLGHKKVA